MNISTVFNSMYTAIKDLYQAAVDYHNAMKALSNRLSNSLVPEQDPKKVQAQISLFRKSPEGGYIRDERARIEEKRMIAFDKANKDFKAATENLPEAVAEYQPEFDVNSDALQNSLNIAKLGKNLPEAAARDLLYQFRTNKLNFDIVRGAMLKDGVNSDYIKGIYPFDGENMQFEYDAMMGKIGGRSDPTVFLDLGKLEKQMIKDAAEFNVQLSPFVDEEYKDEGSETRTRAIMGVSKFDALAEL